ncbi:MAG: hypothetical protein ACI8WM_003259 [Burkholderiaceae bacterium]|jgi:hypothetical protein
MSKEAVFAMKLESELRAAFMAAAQASHRPASQIVRDMTRGFVQNQHDARDYDEFLRDKVATVRLSMQAGSGKTNDMIEARFAARRAELIRKNEE